jgi:hypothetical protein
MTRFQIWTGNTALLGQFSAKATMVENRNARRNMVGKSVENDLAEYEDEMKMDLTEAPWLRPVSSGGPRYR